VRRAASVAAALATKLESVDLIMSDLGLPDGSGLDILRQLKTVRVGRYCLRGNDRLAQP
jgi:DNA-binding response OmpR family regulator